MKYILIFFRETNQAKGPTTQELQYTKYKTRKTKRKTIMNE